MRNSWLSLQRARASATTSRQMRSTRRRRRFRRRTMFPRRNLPNKPSVAMIPRLWACEHGPTYSLTANSPRLPPSVIWSAKPESHALPDGADNRLCGCGSNLPGLHSKPCSRPQFIHLHMGSSPKMEVSTESHFARQAIPMSLGLREKVMRSVTAAATSSTQPSWIADVDRWASRRSRRECRASRCGYAEATIRCSSPQILHITTTSFMQICLTSSTCGCAGRSEISTQTCSAPCLLRKKMNLSPILSAMRKPNKFFEDGFSRRLPSHLRRGSF